MSNVPSAATDSLEATRPKRRSRRKAGIAKVPHEALIKRILDVVYIEGLPYIKAADRLNQLGVPTRSGRGRWQQASISQLMLQYGYRTRPGRPKKTVNA